MQKQAVINRGNAAKNVNIISEEKKITIWNFTAQIANVYKKQQSFQNGTLRKTRQYNERDKKILEKTNVAQPIRQIQNQLT
jgi:hypothetical protein